MHDPRPTPPDLSPDRIATAVDELIGFGRSAQRRGLLTSTCGNASVKVGERALAVTASGSAIGSCSAADIVFVDLHSGAVIRGDGRPSMETDLHRHAYLSRPEVRAVLHGQSPNATLLACMQDPPRDLDLLPELPAYVRKHTYADWAMPGSDALARAVTAALADPDVTVVQMRNHGQIIVGATPGEVLRRGEFFELACFIAASGARLRTIPAEDAVKLRSYGRKPGGESSSQT